MTRRDHFKRWVCIGSAVALVVAVMTSPIRPVPTLNGFASPNYLHRNFATPSTHLSHQAGKSVATGHVRVKAVTSEQRIEGRGKQRLLRRVVRIAPTHPSPSKQGRVIFRILPAAHPLRC